MQRTQEPALSEAEGTGHSTFQNGKRKVKRVGHPSIVITTPDTLHYITGHLHYITFSCYHRRPFLGKPRRRDLFLEILAQVRVRYSFVVVSYVVMPEHVHLLISEPDRGTHSTLMQVLKQRFGRRVLSELRKRRKPEQGRLWEEALDANSGCGAVVGRMHAMSAGRC